MDVGTVTPCGNLGGRCQVIAPNLEAVATLCYDTGGISEGVSWGWETTSSREVLPSRCCGRVGLRRWGNSYSLTSPFRPCVEGERPASLIASCPVSGHPDHTPSTQGETEAITSVCFILLSSQEKAVGRASPALWSTASLCDVQKSLSYSGTKVSICKTELWFFPEQKRRLMERL